MSNTKLIHLSKSFTMEARLYAIMKTTILGLPNSGKSHTALVLAEELLENQIPIVAFDPAGVWWSLKTGVNGNKGYPVVVAGGEHADIPLTPASAKNIMDAAMKANIPIVFDLSGEETAHKTDWRKIVKDTVNHLYYHNKQYGIRHIFLEEAAEFVPQRIQDFDVYSVIDKTIRIGRNKGLGITLINQRAAAINKEAYENCNLNILHNQEGRNSLKQIQDWFTVKKEDAGKEIMQSIPNLNPGECWIIGNRMEPVKVQVRPRKTYHPDPYQEDDSIPSTAKMANVKGFVEKLVSQLKEVDKIVDTGKAGKVNDLEVKTLKEQLDLARITITRREEEITRLNEEVKRLGLDRTGLINTMQQAASILTAVNGKHIGTIQSAAVSESYTTKQHTPTPAPERTREKRSAPAASGESHQASGSGKVKIMKAIHTFYPTPISKQLIGIIAGMSAKGGTFNEYFRQLKREGHIEGDGTYFTLSDKGRSVIAATGNGKPLSTDPDHLINMWIEIEGAGSKKANMLRCLYDNHQMGWIDRNTFAYGSEMAGSGGTFNEYKRQLKRKGLIQEQNGRFKLADEFFFYSK
jgi:hypothetical protein